MRYGENADQVIKGLKTKMKDVEKGLPEGVKFHTAYDRSELIEAAVKNIKEKLMEEITIVCLIVILFLLHWRSALSIIIQIPITIAISFILLNAFGITSNIMSLTGIALAIGVIVDNGIIMSENAYRNLSEFQNSHQPNKS
jgi:Cu/Ag efflux pump CusA